MTLLAHTAEMERIADRIRRRLMNVDLAQHLPTVQLGHADASAQLNLLTTSAASFAESMTPQVAAIANAITLGADDVTSADRIDTHPEGQRRDD